MAELDDNPLKQTPEDHLHTVVRAAFSAVQIPGVAGPATELFCALFRPPVMKRLEAWLDLLIRAFAELREKVEGFDPDSLASNEDLVSAVQHATQIAVRTHQQEKLDALHNAVLNVAAGTAPGDDLQLMFLGFVDVFTPLHLRMLKFFQDPSRSLACAGKRPPLHPSVYNTMAEVLPIASLTAGFGEQVFLDLVNRSLVSAHGLQEGQPRAWAHVLTGRNEVTEKRTTPLGDAFFAFIESPKPQAP